MLTVGQVLAVKPSQSEWDIKNEKVKAGKGKKKGGGNLVNQEDRC